jgi:hypothetical protein
VDNPGRHLSVAIMAHRARRHLVPDLQAQLAGAAVVWDRHQDRWDTGRRAMLAHDPEASWHLVVQDDALLCQEFLRQAAEALRHAPAGPVAFYMGTTGRLGIMRPREAVAKARAMGATWVAAEGPRWGVAVAVPTAEIPAMLSWCDGRAEENYDLRIAEYWKARGCSCFYSVPSLVEHRTGPAFPSLVPGRGCSPYRTAALWLPGGQDRSWGTGAVWPDPGVQPGQGVSVCIMGHPDREEYLPELLEALPGASLVVDHGGGVWDTAQAAWQARDPAAAWHVVVQDDAVPCQGFLGLLSELLVDPVACYGLFFGREVGHLVRMAERQLLAGETEVVANRLYWGPAIALPTYLVGDVLSWCERQERRGAFPDGWAGKRADSRIGRFFLEHGFPVRYPIPCLVDHRAGPSLVGGYRQTPGERVAWWWRDGDAPAAVQRIGRDLSYQQAQGGGNVG